MLSLEVALLSPSSGVCRRQKLEKHKALATALGTQAETGLGQMEVGVQTMAVSY